MNRGNTSEQSWKKKKKKKLENKHFSRRCFYQRWTLSSFSSSQNSSHVYIFLFLFRAAIDCMLSDCSSVGRSHTSKNSFEISQSTWPIMVNDTITGANIVAILVYNISSVRVRIRIRVSIDIFILLVCFIKADDWIYEKSNAKKAKPNGSMRACDILLILFNSSVYIYTLYVSENVAIALLHLTFGTSKTMCWGLVVMDRKRHT